MTADARRTSFTATVPPLLAAILLGCAGFAGSLFMTKSIIEKSMGGRITDCNHDDCAEFRIEV